MYSIKNQILEGVTFVEVQEAGGVKKVFVTNLVQIPATIANVARTHLKQDTGNLQTREPSFEVLKSNIKQMSDCRKIFKTNIE